MTSEIPGPKGLPFIGNVLDIKDEVPIHGVERLFDIYGPIVKFTVMGKPMVVVGGFDLFDELCDETRFFKLLTGSLDSSNNPGAPPPGLFTAKTEKSEDWGQAHRILMPAFGPLAIEQMFDEMHDIASQLVLKWARQGPEQKILSTDDFTRLTLDTIALCAMDYRFNSFYQEEMHPFVQSMNIMLNEKASSMQLMGIVKRLIPSHNEFVRNSNHYMNTVAMELVDHRRKNPSEKKDLLNAMIYGKDPKTGETMRDELIAANMVTFLIAGHETTSGLLSFAFLFMLKNPSTYFAAKAEVDRVVGKERLQPKHLKELKYINAVLRETLRLCPTAPGFSRGVRPENKEDKVTIGGGKYEIPRGVGVTCMLGKIQQDPKVYPEPQEFRPERMLDGEFEKLPKNAWKPFGTGMRGCIGRAFAWQEALMCVALILQNFDVAMDDPSYEFKVVQSLTIKPKDFYIRATLREDINALALQERLSGSSIHEETKDIDSKKAGKANGSEAQAMTILYGSNTGTCQTLAQKLASQASSRGYKPEVRDLDSAMSNLPRDQPVVIVTASYEGQPPDNAARFVAWLESLTDSSMLSGAKYAMFGCGHRDWVSTYQRIPTLVDDLLSKFGATQLAERGSCDASQGEVFADFDAWTEGKLWPALGSASTDSTGNDGHIEVPTVEMDISTEERASHLQQNVQWAKVASTKSLCSTAGSEKRHIEFDLPTGMTYSTGDYLAILPLNPEQVVRRVIQRFGLPWDGVVKINEGGSTTLPTEHPISVFDLLGGYVELSQPIIRKASFFSRSLAKDLDVLISLTSDVTHKSQLESYTDAETFKSEIVAHHVTLLDLLERCPSIELAFPSFLALLPPLRARYYSISSSPLHDPTSCTLTYSVIDAPSWSGAEAHYHGVAGTYLASLRPGDQALVAVRSTNKYFRLPADPEATPIVMLCAGTGIAPFRGFVQERAEQIREGGRKLAPALLFAGCRSPADDRLYADELDAWAALGAVDVRYAFSRDPGASGGCAHVQDRLWADREDVYGMWDKGARFYTCGSGGVAKACGEAGVRMAAERVGQLGRGDQVSMEQLLAWKQSMRNERFISDVFD